MNRSITLLGVVILLSAGGLIAFPFLTTGAVGVDLELELGIFVLPVGLSVILWGASSPDPSITTVGGLFGNPDENVLRKRLAPPPPTGPARFMPNPRESANCVQCYTAIPADEVVCPRCGRPRECRGCGKRLFFLAGGVRCAPCLRNEVYCGCPKVKRAMTHADRRRAVGRTR